jgi:hypothetical protein
MRRPRLKRRCIAGNQGKIRVVKPVENLLFLAHSSISLTVFAVFTAAMSECSLGSILVALVVVRFLPPATNEEHVSRLDVAALSSGTNVYSLVFAAIVKILP